MHRHTHAYGCLCVIVVTLLAGPCPAAAPRPERPGGAEMAEFQRQHIASARAMAAQLLPTSAQLSNDKSWKYLWEAPAALNGGIASADDYWARQSAKAVPLGMPPDKAQALLDQVTALASRSPGAGPREATLMMLIQFRNSALPLADRMEAEFAATARMLEAARSRNERRVVDAALAPYRNMTLEQAQAAFIRQATLVQKASALPYCKSNNWTAVAQCRSEQEMVQRRVWFGVVRVAVLVVDPDRIGEVPDLKDPTALESRLSSQLRGIMTDMIRLEEQRIIAEIRELEENADADSAQEIARLRDKLARDSAAASRAAVKVYPRRFGDNSYVIRLFGISPETPGLGASVYSGWLRNGGAFVHIEFGGNFPEEQMLREMDHFLSEMEARTRAYGGIGDDLGGMGPGPAKKEPMKIPALPTVDDLRK